MLEQLNTYDWEEAFAYCSGVAEALGSSVPKQVAPGVPVDDAPFRREDVARIVAISEGQNDEQDWVGVFVLEDGRFACLEAGCDYTGWD